MKVTERALDRTTRVYIHLTTAFFVDVSLEDRYRGCEYYTVVCHAIYGLIGL